MEAASSDRKTFQIIDNGQQLGEMVYENLFFLKAKLILSNAEIYEINPGGIFGTVITVAKNGTEIAKLQMNWRGQIVFSFQDGQEFLLKSTGIFNSKFVLENQDGEKLIQFDPKFNWRKFHYNYDISFDNPPNNILLLFLGVYASNYFIAAMAGMM